MSGIDARSTKCNSTLQSRTATLGNSGDVAAIKQRCRRYFQSCKFIVTEPQPAFHLFAARCCKAKDIRDIDINAAARSATSVGRDIAIVSPHEDIAVEGDVAARASTRIGGNSAVAAQLDVSR